MRGQKAIKAQKTVRLPRPLLKEAESLLRACGHCESLNDFIVRSMRLRIEVLKRKELDSRFAEMPEDPDCQKEAHLLAEEFASSDWDAAKLLEEL